MAIVVFSFIFRDPLKLAVTIRFFFCEQTYNKSYKFIKSIIFERDYGSVRVRVCLFQLFEHKLYFLQEILSFPFHSFFVNPKFFSISCFSIYCTKRNFDT